MRDKVERLTAEGLISMSEAAVIYGGVNKATPTRHALRGVRLADGSVLRLEAIKVSSHLRTSRQAVLRFFAAQNEATGADEAPVASGPAVSKLAREAHAALASVLGN